MELPGALKAAVERELERTPLGDLQRAAATLSQRYRAETRDGRMHLDADLAVKAYLATRLPATYAAVRSSLEAVAEALPDFAPITLLDVGAGPGTALWAVADCWASLRSARLLEASMEARTVGAQLSKQLPSIQADWQSADVSLGVDQIDHADLVTMAYVLDELDPKSIPPLVSRLWSLATTLIIVEPGTSAGWRRILGVRQQLIEAGANIVAPCPHAQPCPLLEPDWCHFARRLARSRLHRLAKGGDAPFEDEKYIFTAATRLPVAARPARVLAPPRQSKGRIEFKLCQPDSRSEEVLVSKRDGDAYRVARRLGWGDAFDPVSS
ncbi:MAG: small ribosomal subunit Rsm22 family protein [Rhizobiaceae bacterium]